MKSLIIESWRFIPHSFALVNQFHCLELLKRTEIKLYHRDMPYLGNYWQSASGLFPENDETLLHSIPVPTPTQIADVTFRFTFPFNLSPSTSSKTIVMGVANYAMVKDSAFIGAISLQEATQRPDLILLAPSEWSREGFIRSGAAPDRVFVVPHGVDTEVFGPLLREQRNTLRASMHWENSFVFLHIGAMTGNKGILGLLKAFSQVVARHPNALLILKGIDSLYRSQDFLQHTLQNLSEHERHTVESHIGYIGGVLPLRELAKLYQAADVYLSPYSAEGFNLPVLEAIACGLPVICTQGGPTDDFTDRTVALHIESERQSEMFDGKTGYRLVPNQEHLTSLMEKIAMDDELRSSLQASGPKFVSERFTWKHTVDKLLNFF